MATPCETWPSPDIVWTMTNRGGRDCSHFWRKVSARIADWDRIRGADGEGPGIAALNTDIIELFRTLRWLFVAPFVATGKLQAVGRTNHTLASVWGVTLPVKPPVSRECTCCSNVQPRPDFTGQMDRDQWVE